MRVRVEVTVCFMALFRFLPFKFLREKDPNRKTAPPL